MSTLESNNGAGQHTVLAGLTLDALEPDTGQARRFYPAQLPSFANEPTRDRFTILLISPQIGEGVISLTGFQPGELVFTCTGFFSESVTLFSLQIKPTLHLHDPYFYGKLLHSCDPNTFVDTATRRFYALKPIAPGDIVTLDYARSEDVLSRTFPCNCGASNCRGLVAGRKQLTAHREKTRLNPKNLGLERLQA